VAYQARLIDIFGVPHGIRDEALLDTALAKPEATFDGKLLHEDTWAMAAAYGYHLCRSHPFIDGNQRIAAVAMGTFLAVNGEPSRLDEGELYLALTAVADGQMDKTELASWLRARARVSR
jgi:death-on-curing protein